VNGNPISNNSTVPVSPGDECVIGVSIRNDGTAPSGNVILHLATDFYPDPSFFEVVNADDINLGTIQNNSTCIDTPSAYQVNVSNSADEYYYILLWITIYESAVPKKTFAFALQVPPAGT
jgi:uncharacterized membrane protein